MVFWKRKKKTAKEKSVSGEVSTKINPVIGENAVSAPANNRELYDAILKEVESKGGKTSIHANTLSQYEIILALPDQERAAFLTAFPALSEPVNDDLPDCVSASLDFGAKGLLRRFYSVFMRRKNNFTPEQLLEILTVLRTRHATMFHGWPIGWVVHQLGKSVKAHGLSDMTQSGLREVAESKLFDQHYYGSDLKKAKANLLHIIGNEDGAVMEFPLGKTQLADVMRAELQAMPDTLRNEWMALFHIAASAAGSKPTKKFSDGLDAAIKDITPAAYKKQIGEWLTAALKPESFHIENLTRWQPLGQPDEISNLLKGLVWGMARFHDEASLATIAKLTEKCFNRLPGVGPAAPALGNACIYTLANSKGLSGVGHLSRLKLRIKQNNTQKLIQTNIEKQAARLGLKPAQIEDMAAPDFGLTLGIKDIAFEDYTLRVDASEVGQAALSWLKPDGSAQKSVPSFIKDKAPLKKKLANIRAQAKEIKKASTAQRDRIDRLFTEDMHWAPEDFEKYYLNHGLIGPLARKLVWLLSVGGKDIAALYHAGKWTDATGKAVKGKPDSYALWHPIMSEAADVLSWRSRLEVLKIKQAIKQTYREVYILTDAEINTRVYSNRMAAHILKQHQFRTLAAIRGWKYQLMGAYDDGRDNAIASKYLPAYGLTAQFWIDEILDEDSFNDAGIWNYVATDQVRFSSDRRETIDLIDIPPIILSETLRDTDLFVGVASVGNDPTWGDRGGAPRTQEYWQSYSFGDLSETAKTRKTVLEGLLPKLKIRDKARIEGRFLIVEGKIKTYKIHIGSGNIMIMPNDQYLCIVLGRGQDKSLSNIYLPFEGDRGLSIVLSKAFLLFDDDKITDATILSQINRK